MCDKRVSNTFLPWFSEIATNIFSLYDVECCKTLFPGTFDPEILSASLFFKNLAFYGEPEKSCYKGVISLDRKPNDGAELAQKVMI